MAIIPGLGMVPAFISGQSNERPAGTSLLMHFDGADNSTTLTDETGKTVTVGGNTKLTTASPKFGTACATFDGSGDYFRLPLTSDFQFGTGDFTIAFFYKTTTNSTMHLCSNQGSLNNSAGNYAIELTFTSGRVSVLEGGAARLNDLVSGLNNGNWHHLAVTRAGGALRAFVDGIHTGTTYTSSYNYVTGGSYGFYFGQRSGGTNGFNGQLDEMIVVKGQALWTSNFTPPVEPYL